MARLLWRGSFNTIDANQDSNALHGLAIVASSFSLLAPHPSPFRTDEDDPFSTTSPIKADSNAELCLDLEMLRNRPLGVLRRVRLQSASLDATGESESHSKLGKVHGRRGLKQSIEMLRKGKQKEAVSEEIVQLEEGDNPGQTDNISLYIDERCPESIAYFNDGFCREEVDPASGRTRFGLLLSLVGNTVEDDLLDDTSSSNVRSTVVVYGRLQEHANASGRVLQLCVARQKDKKRQLGPRPDDPAPRGWSTYTVVGPSADCLQRRKSLCPEASENRITACSDAYIKHGQVYRDSLCCYEQRETVCWATFSSSAAKAGPHNIVIGPFACPKRISYPASVEIIVFGGAKYRFVRRK